MEVLIDCRTAVAPPKAYEEIISKVAVEAALAVGDYGDYEVSVSIVDDSEIRELNRRFRNIDKETDVLSFPNGDQSSPELGDIIISVQRMYLQARLYGHDPQRELGFLTAHGMLHLFGFDHEDLTDEREMRDLQNRIMTACGLDIEENT